MRLLLSFGYAYDLLLRLFLQSIAFHSIGLSGLLWEPVGSVNAVLRTYRGKIFGTGGIRLFLMVFSIYFVSTLLVPVFSGDFTGFWVKCSQMVGITIIFGLGTYINWKFGLKKYEGYG